MRSWIAEGRRCSPEVGKGLFVELLGRNELCLGQCLAEFLAKTAVGAHSFDEVGSALLLRVRAGGGHGQEKRGPVAQRNRVAAEQEAQQNLLELRQHHLGFFGVEGGFVGNGLGHFLLADFLDGLERRMELGTFVRGSILGCLSMISAIVFWFL